MKRIPEEIIKGKLVEAFKITTEKRMENRLVLKTELIFDKILINQSLGLEIEQIEITSIIVASREREISYNYSTIPSLNSSIILRENLNFFTLIVQPTTGSIDDDLIEIRLGMNVTFHDGKRLDNISILLSHQVSVKAFWLDIIFAKFPPFNAIVGINGEIKTDNEVLITLKNSSKLSAGKVTKEALIVDCYKDSSYKERAPIELQISEIKKSNGGNNFLQEGEKQTFSLYLTVVTREQSLAKSEEKTTTVYLLVYPSWLLNHSIDTICSRAQKYTLLLKNETDGSNCILGGYHPRDSLEYIKHIEEPDQMVKINPIIPLPKYENYNESNSIHQAPPPKDISKEEIKLHYASALLSGISAYAEDQKFKDMEAKIKEIKDLCYRGSNSKLISFYAEALFQAISTYAKIKMLGELEKKLSEIKRLYEYTPNNEKVKECYARSLSKAVECYANAKKFESMEKKIAESRMLYEKHCGNRIVETEYNRSINKAVDQIWRKN